MKAARSIVRLVGALVLALGGSIAQADWIYVPEEGGWKDTQTGLVWFDLVISNDGNPSTGDETLTWIGVNQATNGLVLYALDDYGLIAIPLDDWRLPTVEEMQTAAAHGIGAASDQAVANGMMPIIYGAPGVGYLWWSSYVRANKATVVNLRTGITSKVLVSSSFRGSTTYSTLLGICVRQSSVEP